MAKTTVTPPVATPPPLDIASWLTPATMIGLGTLMLMALKTYTEVRPVLAKPKKKVRSRKRKK